MDPLNVTVAGSRYPISITPSVPPVKTTAIKATSPPISSPSSSSSPAHPPSRIRRKPIQTYKSPSLSDGFRIDSQSNTQNIPQSFSTSSHTSSSSSEKTERPPPRTRQQQPSLSLYHPLGRLAQSLPPLDPRVFGLQNPVSIDDNDMQIDDAHLRRASSRTRRPAAKVRDRNDEEVDDQVSVNGATGVEGSTAERETRPTVSPRKRRAAGAGGAGGPKRRRKDADDGTFPQPARRTRNPRGVAVASPLAGVALAATDAGEEGGSPAPTEVTDLQTAVLQAQEVRPVRSTRSRATLNRRDSSTSSGTSASVSVAVNLQQVRAVESETAETPAQDVDMNEVTVNGEVGETNGGALVQDVQQDGQTHATQPASSVPSAEVEPKSDPSPPPETSTTNVRAEESAKDPEPAPFSDRRTLPTSTDKQPAKSVPVVQPKPVEDEKEEGELSDGPSA
ncbi:hypothetical protein BXZ70DRAFT_948467 [Cristinia sonorae]|uniref:Uncharacterized protein n=1 Tax=Cristinia sonorae TaxID=1940300 RepID=A0A8K0UJ18_9AGAR|nr:hypothetical protein BXZ70DRAFT_948467 [Cristinia sonorae]